MGVHLPEGLPGDRRAGRPAHLQEVPGDAPGAALRGAPREVRARSGGPAGLVLLQPRQRRRPEVDGRRRQRRM